MTSGIFVRVPLNDIIVEREVRQRRELTGIEELAESIRRVGLIHPITIDRNLVLIAGERRYEAFKLLGYSDIPCQFVDEAETEHHRTIELEENIRRVGIEWKDECAAVLEYHSLQADNVAEWKMEDTAAALGMDLTTVHKKISVAKALIEGDPLVIAAPKYSTARGIVERQAARKDEKALLELRQTIKAPEAPKIESILTADFNEWATTYSGPKFNFIHCDFPYGINADKFNQGAAPLHGGYADTEEVYWTLLKTLCENLDRIAADSCHIMFWFSMHFYTDTLRFFQEQSDFRIDPFPLIWTKSDNVGILPDPSRGPRRIYETCLFGSRGDRKIVRSVSNSISLPSVRDQHMSIKPQPMLESFFRMFVDSSTVMLDPTCGSGSSIRAAESVGASHVLGLERNPEFADRARTALASFRAMKKDAAE